jgi:AcrR family transcriptional regulator
MPMSAPQRRPVAGPGTPPRLRKGERKRQLLTHARELLARHGYQETTLERLAETAGVSLGIVKRHFPSRKAVFADWLAAFRQTTWQRWQTEMAELSDPLAKLHAVIDLYLASVREQAVDYRILHRALLEEAAAEVLDLVQAFYLEGETLLAQIIGEGQQSGVFRRSLDPRVGAWQLLQTALGHTLIQPVGVPLQAEPDYLPRAVDCLLHGLLKTDV